MNALIVYSTLIFFVGTPTLLFVFLHCFLVKSRLALAATNRWCDAGDCVFDWRMSNHIGVGESKYAQGLVLEEIAAYEEFLKTHSYIPRDEKYIKHLNTLLKERSPDPPPPKKRKRTHVTSRFARDVFCSVRRCAVIASFS